MAKKTVSFAIEASRLSTVLTALGPFLSHVSELRVTDDTPTAPAKRRMSPRLGALGERRVGLIKLITDTFPPQDSFVVSVSSLLNMADQAGYAPSSVSSTMSRLAKDGWSITRTTDGYAVTRPGVKLSS